MTRLRHNAATVVDWCRRAGLEVYAVTKGVRGDPRVARAFLDGGVAGLADSRLANLALLQNLRLDSSTSGGGRAAEPGRRAVNRPRLRLLRPPTPDQAVEAACLCDDVLCASPETVEALARGAESGRPLGVLLTVDLGDLREGLLPEDVLGAAVGLERRLASVAGQRDPGRRAHVAGLATNLACFGGLVPTRAHLEEMADLGRRVAAALDRPVRVSAGNTATLPLVLEEPDLPPGLDDLRIGEGILLGRESLHRRPLPGCHLDAFTFWGTVIEVGSKPSCPSGERARDAFGHRPAFVDRGRRRRAIINTGRQDIVPEGLEPLGAGLEVVGATGDHLVLDVDDYPGRLGVGSEVGFAVNYACLLQAMTSPDVARVYVGVAEG